MKGDRNFFRAFTDWERVMEILLACAVIAEIILSVVFEQGSVQVFN